MDKATFVNMRGPGLLQESPGRGHGDDDAPVWIVAAYYAAEDGNAQTGWIAESNPDYTVAAAKVAIQAEAAGNRVPVQTVLVDCCTCGAVGVRATPFGKADRGAMLRGVELADIYGLRIALEGTFEKGVQHLTTAGIHEPKQ